MPRRKICWKLKSKLRPTLRAKPSTVLCVLCGMANAAYQRPDEVFVMPVTALKE